MTKMVRIENADTTSYKVKVQVQDKSADGEWVDSGKPIDLDFPTAMTVVGIHSTRRLVVTEVN